MEYIKLFNTKKGMVYICAKAYKNAHDNKTYVAYIEGETRWYGRGSKSFYDIAFDYKTKKEAIKQVRIFIKKARIYFKNIFKSE